MPKRLQGLVVGMLVGILLAGGTVFAKQSTETIQVAYNNIKIYIDGNLVQPKDANGNTVEPFIYNGTTYLPVRAVGEAFGKTVDWDGTTQSVYVGKRPGNDKNMFDLVPAYQSNDYEEYSIARGGSDSFSMAGIKYWNGCALIGGYGKTPYSIYNLNGQYSTISGTLGHVDDSSMSDNVLQIFYDGVLHREITLSGDMIPTNLTLDVTGVLQLKFSMYSDHRSGTYGLGNPVIE